MGETREIGYSGLLGMYIKLQIDSYMQGKEESSPKIGSLQRLETWDTENVAERKCYF